MKTLCLKGEGLTCRPGYVSGFENLNAHRRTQINKKEVENIGREKGDREEREC